MNCNVGRDFFERFKIIFVYDDTVLNAIDSQIWVAAIELFLKKKKTLHKYLHGAYFFFNSSRINMQCFIGFRYTKQ